MKEGAYNTAKKYDIKKIIPQYEEVYKLFQNNHLGLYILSESM